PLVVQGTLLARNGNTLNGTVTAAAGSVIRVQGTLAGDADLIVAGGLTNNGLIELTSADLVRSATLDVRGVTLTNAAGGTLAAVPGARGRRLIHLTHAP